jgi:hypothetical protein
VLFGDAARRGVPGSLNFVSFVLPLLAEGRQQHDSPRLREVVGDPVGDSIIDDIKKDIRAPLPAHSDLCSIHRTFKVPLETG